MATNNLRSLAVAILLVGLFTFALINFGFHFARQNNAPTIMENQAINSTFGSLTSTLGGYQEQSNDSSTSFYSETPPEEVGEAINLRSIVSVTAGMFSLVTGTFSLLTQMVMITLGVGATSAKIIVGTFSAIMVFSLVLLAWSVIRSGR